MNPSSILFSYSTFTFFKSALISIILHFILHTTFDGITLGAWHIRLDVFDVAKLKDTVEERISHQLGQFFLARKGMLIVNRAHSLSSKMKTV